MSRVKGKNTRPEIVVRSLLHRLGYRFRLHRKDLPGKPDVVLPKWRTVLMVNGCFWHRHEGCRNTRTPKSRLDFWSRKFDDNIRRDRLNRERLETLGWRVVIVWECELTDIKALADRLDRCVKEKACDPSNCSQVRGG